MADLRSLWPSLRYRQRDTLVATAMGWGVDRGLPEFSTSWNGLGLILDECQRRDWLVEMAASGCASGRQRWTTVEIVLNPSAGYPKVFSDRGTAPDSLALAFCLACRVEVPEKWEQKPVGATSEPAPRC